MHQVILGAALSGVIFSAGSAYAAEVRFQGTFFVTAISSTCSSSEAVAAVGDNYVFAYRLSDDGEAFALFDTRKAYQFEPSSPRRFGGSGSYSGAKIKSGADASDTAGNYAVFRIKPATPDATTPQVLVTGRLTNFDRNGCTVTFSASGVLRP